MRIERLLFLCFALPALAGCIDSKPKTLGGKNKLDFGSTSTETTELFRFNFALKGATAGTATTFYLQAATNSKTAMISTCNLAGSGCTCKFFKSDGVSSAGPDATGAANVTYDERGNYFKCIYNDDASDGLALADVAKVRIQNNSGTVTSIQYDVDTTLTIAKLMGSDLNLNRVRSVYRYACEYNFLQKAGTTTLTFDCSAPLAGNTCDTVTPSDANHFCLLKARFPYYLYSDNYSTNFNLRISDKIYNGGGTDSICGLQIKQIDCVGTAPDDYGTPDKSFGLYGEQTGIWDTAVALSSGPDLVPLTMGYAARTNTAGDCPPGLVKRIFFKADTNPLVPDSGIVTTDMTPTHNFTSGLRATEVADPTTLPSPFTVNKVTGGTCTGIVCSMPSTTLPAPANPVKSVAYHSNGQTAFCVIPETILP